MDRSRPNFTDLYCARFGVDSLEFGPHLTARCLHRPYCWIGRWLLSMNRTAFDLDLELALQCGTFTSRRMLEAELHEFTMDYRNRGLWRRYLRCRISTHRLRRIFRDTIRQSDHVATRAAKTAE